MTTERVLIVGSSDEYNRRRMFGLCRILGYNPHIVILDEVGTQEDTDAFCEMLDKHRMQAVEATMRDARKAYGQKHGPRDRWGKCK